MRPSRSPRPDSPPPTTISPSTASSGRATGHAFQKAHAATLAASPLIDIRLGATVVEIEFAENGRATGVVVATADGRRLSTSRRRTRRARRRRARIDAAAAGGATPPAGAVRRRRRSARSLLHGPRHRRDRRRRLRRRTRRRGVRLPARRARLVRPPPLCAEPGADGALRPAQRRLLAGRPADRRPASSAAARSPPSRWRCRRPSSAA